LKQSLKEHREGQCLTQQELADKSGVSMRTIQRIEKNLSSGSPYVIKSLCTALGIGISSLEISKSGEVEENEKVALNFEGISEAGDHTKTVKQLNLCSLAVVIFPFLNLIAPLIFFYINHEKLKNVSNTLKILDFQIIWTLVTAFLVIIFKSFFYIELGGFPMFIWIYFICILFNIVIVLRSASQLNKGLNILGYLPKIL
jgi:transcriptional regulator with XRE-family HTH domain